MTKVAFPTRDAETTGPDLLPKRVPRPPLHFPYPPLAFPQAKGLGRPAKPQGSGEERRGATPRRPPSLRLPR